MFVLLLLKRRGIVPIFSNNALQYFPRIERLPHDCPYYPFARSLNLSSATNSPLLMIITRSQIASTSCRIWEENNTVLSCPVFLLLPLFRRSGWGQDRKLVHRSINTSGSWISAAANPLFVCNLLKADRSFFCFQFLNPSSSITLSIFCFGSVT